MDGSWALTKLPRCLLLLLVFHLFLSRLVASSPDSPRPHLRDVKSTEKQLVKQLLDRYERQGKEGRPVVNTSDIISVHFGLYLIQILDVDEKDQILKTNIWYQYEWRDELLTWNPEDYDNISDVRLPSDKIWIPDILLYNFADDRLKEQRNALVVTYSTGDLLWMPQAILRSSCSFDTKFFPFDEQECILKFSSWSYNGFKLDIHFLPNKTAFDLDDYIESNEWEITQNTAKRHVKRYTCCPEPYPDLRFKLRIRRRVAFYTFILVMPCALLSLLTLVIFWVPPESPAKLILGMNIFLAFFVLLLLLAESTPKAAASVPLIGVYFCLNMVMITMSTVLTTVVANMFYRGVRINRAPKWLRVLMIDIIARILCLRDKVADPDYSTSSEKKPSRSWNTGRVGGNPKGQYPYTDVNFAQVRLLDNGAEKSRGTPPPPPPPGSGSVGAFGEMADNGFQQGGDDFSSPGVAPLMEEVRAIRDILEKVRDKKNKMDEKEKFVREWRIISCVTDRVIFITYLLINFIGLTVIFLWQFNRKDLSPPEDD
ncbi:neuronal acetylcholine receptor subunit alpha-10-like [Pomacea canaliculata]|uniref:neuronal acetylcholine receptor subunit alpha-10-like n=1 Tax=Pomacea canaliculata TaxID=400727 RepID=UPI000D72E4A0|nr:neuronal acetylcholine receptor subunit alpha-10-like [Pomacea canaliculata]XP_025101190.1 neuronal acetylcholine receptor subunit alpha-10-like [Pomacea canaliculata]XP_025101198.1 neuronal acetylcholine receptor subunit alpha-10-like [Pomacea canaliculata]XP_025101209.1 neuronal acetylcholine receptor subunit alpha-10-like [Pomacea canaliculata]XP_025101215.1 neuronal acetylcholine receptor subunit alpha-10-like [Pomacea canaliculata]